MENDNHLRDLDCSSCNGEGGYWENGPGSNVICTQCSTNWNRIRGFIPNCICEDCVKARINYRGGSYI